MAKKGLLNLSTALSSNCTWNHWNVTSILEVKRIWVFTSSICMYICLTVGPTERPVNASSRYWIWGVWGEWIGQCNYSGGIAMEGGGGGT